MWVSFESFVLLLDEKQQPFSAALRNLRLANLIVLTCGEMINQIREVADLLPPPAENEWGVSLMHNLIQWNSI